MADNFLERQRRDYEARKEMWLKKKKAKTTSVASAIMKKASERFNDE